MRFLVNGALFVTCVFGVLLASSRLAMAGSTPSRSPEKASAGMRGDQPDRAGPASASPSTAKKGGAKSVTAKPDATKPAAGTSTTAKPKAGGGGAIPSGQIATPSSHTAVFGGGSGGKKPKSSAGSGSAGTPKQSSAQAETGPGQIIGHVHVMDKSSYRPAVGAEVSVVRDGRVVATASTTVGGRYELAGLAYGQYTIRAKLGKHKGELVNRVVFRPENGSQVASGVNINIR